MKVLILWADHHSRNLGVRVLAEGTATLVRREFGRNTQVEFQDFSPGESGLSFGGANAVRDLGRKSGPIKARLNPFDLIIDTGAGDSFTDIYGLKRLAIMTNVHRIAHQLQIPIVMGPQTVGPFNTRTGRVLASRSLALMQSVLVRDEQSLANALALGREDVTNATDVVFALPDPTPSEARDVILNVSGLLASPNRHVDNKAYLDAVHRLIESLLQMGRRVSLLAHVLDHPGEDNDVPIIRQLTETFSDSVEPLIPQDLTNVRELLASSRLVIGSRMHACLNALSVGTPAIPWAYSRKFAPLLAQVEWPHVVDLRSSKDPTGETLQLLRDQGEAAMATMSQEVRDSAHAKTRTPRFRE